MEIICMRMQTHNKDPCAINHTLMYLCQQFHFNFFPNFVHRLSWWLWFITWEGLFERISVPKLPIWWQILLKGTNSEYVDFGAFSEFWVKSPFIFLFLFSWELCCRRIYFGVYCMKVNPGFLSTALGFNCNGQFCCNPAKMYLWGCPSCIFSGLLQGMPHAEPDRRFLDVPTSLAPFWAP